MNRVSFSSLVTRVSTVKGGDTYSAFNILEKVTSCSSIQVQPIKYQIGEEDNVQDQQDS
jgi:hypothetical protein